MTSFLTKQQFAAMLQAACLKIEANVDELNKLDAATGDGDHGTSIVKAVRAAAKTMLESPEEQTFKEALHNAGWAVMGEDCGSTSSLYGSFFMGMSDAITKEPLELQEVMKMFQSGLAGIMKHTKAKVGDKTMMDALIPAIEAMATETMQDKANFSEIFCAAAVAAAQGAAATRDFAAKFGRARNLGERSVGHLDAGAISMSYIFDEFAKNFS